MEKIAQIVASICYYADNFLYRSLHIETPMKKKALERRAKRLQKMLDAEHGTHIYEMYWSE